MKVLLAGLAVAASVAVLSMHVAPGSADGAEDGCLPPAGYIRAIQGQVVIKRGGADWRAAVLDEPLCGGDLIRVGDRSRAQVVIANLTTRIDQDTTMSLTYVPADKPPIVSRIEGAAAYFFSRKPRVLEVDTPYFDARVEG